MWKLKDINVEKEQLFKNNNVSPLLSRLMAQRNINHHESFLKADYNSLSNAYSLKGVEEGVKIFASHVKNKSRIAVIGDYDADGVISSTMIHELCKVFKLSCNVFLPSRFDHGYGLNPKTIKSFKEKFVSPPDLLFVLDCGTTNFDDVKDLKEWGVKDIIIIDHHIPGDESKVSTNASVLINWHISKDSHEMCACGEVFQFIRGIRMMTNKVNPIEFLSYAAVGTIADSSPINYDNRIIVRHGLGEYALNHIRASGLKILMNLCKIRSPYMTQMDVSFKLAPRINAVGRLDKPDLVFRLLTQEDVTLADELAKQVDDFNNQRKEIQSKIESQALLYLENYKYKNGIIVIDSNWHIGIVGIVASRVAEIKGKPTLILGSHDGKLKGSGRTIHGINIKKILDDCSFMFEKYGGHAAAIGCVLKDEYKDKAAEIFDAACEKYMNNLTTEEVCSYYDAALKAHSINENLAVELRDKLSPYCNESNSEPIFKINNVKIYNVNSKEGEGWRLLTFNAHSNDVEIPYSFKTFSSKFNTDIEGRTVNIYFQFPQRWNVNDIYSPFDLSVVDMDLL